MGHMIDTSTGSAAIAYVGETPWHELGQQLEPGADVDTWRKAAGLNWEVLRAPVVYRRPFATPFGSQTIEQEVPNRDVLYRSDTGAALSVVSRGYKIHQPADIFAYFDSIAKAGEFELETAGALSGGGRIWALARVGEGAKIIGQDRVDPYLLLATSYDGQMTTTARFTSIRVVCHNTITAALKVPVLGNKDPRIVSSLKLPHTAVFDARLISEQLGIVTGAFGQFFDEARKLAEVGVSDAVAEDLVAEVILKFTSRPAHGRTLDVKSTRGYRRVMELFAGGALGSDLTGGKSAWQLLNAFTQYVDHERGRSADSRLTQAWFGEGEQMKNMAKDLLLGLV
ncbi:DUF932 domain-containing protein [Ramlibacter monticola]|uniref:DUF932 domain-containing protein n=1 Tax=Ramlibacter monticola TaxID=1926872 RepID=A0A936Z5E4_9BURK|nr:DUF932 domain-containing protein [Ramlibacter monticola]MBL0394274.1 DUF932 domain-containing protein [Ramlibacter monticola]